MQRQSNIELIRIVAMISIVVYHFVFHGLFGNSLFGSISPISGNERFIVDITLFFTFGTDLFALISGYFGVHLRWKSIINLWILCSFYYLIALIVNGDYSISKIIHCFIIASKDQWYFTSYLWLLVASPILNTGIAKLTNRDFRVLIIIGFILNCIGGWYFEGENVTGHNFIQLVFIYIIGTYIRKDPKIMSISRHILISSYIVTCALAIAFIHLYTKRGVALMTFHNSPFNVISAVLIFCFISSFNIKNKYINYIAKSMPAVLLLSDVSLKIPLYGFLNKTYIEHGCTTYTLSIFCGLLFAVFALSTTVDQLRRWIAKPITIYLTDKFNKFVDISSLEKR